jgi:release factor glutamine methyltransferase
MTLQSEIVNARRTLEQAGIDPSEAAVDADLLARAVLGWDRARLLASLGDPAPPAFHEPYAGLIARRQRREPAAYIVGYREFWSRQFEVGPSVLVPRPETELIVEEALADLTGRPAPPSPLRGFGAPGASFSRSSPARHPLHIADVGTGSGCLAVTLALELPLARVVATDTSRRALEIARRNAARHEVADRVDFVSTDLLAEVDARFDLIVSNPPYIPASEMPQLPPEVREYEPPEALSGGPDGLDVIRRLLLQAESRLKDHGVLIFEFGFAEDRAVSQAIAARPAFRLEKIRSDLQGIPRTAVARWQPPR